MSKSREPEITMFVVPVIVISLLIIIIFIICKIYLRLTIGKCYCNVYLAGKTALITGGNSGLGYQTALALAGRGCRVIIADKDDCEETRENIIKQTGNSNIITKNFNLACFKSVRKLAKDINENEERLDFLINNAGIGGVGEAYTEDGLHMGMQVNYFGHFLLTHLLIELLKKSASSRIIFVSSILAFLHNLSLSNLNYPKEKLNTPIADLRIYANSKLCAIIAAYEFSKKLYGSNVTVYSVHPGLVYTPIFSKYAQTRSFNKVIYKMVDAVCIKPFAKTPVEGIQTALHTILCQDVTTNTGRFFSDCKVFKVPAKAKDPYFAKKIWEASEKYVKLNQDEMI